MSAAAVLKAASGGASRRLVQTVAIFLVLAASAAAGTLGLTLSTNANAQFLGAFARQHGADLALSIDASKVTAVDLARTRRLPGVTDAAGPYPETYISLAGSGPAASSSAERHGSGIHARTPVTVTPRTPVGRSPQRSSTTTQPSADSGVSGRLIPGGQVNPIAEYPGEGISVAGRASMGGPLDDLILLNGRWATRPGEIVLSHDRPVPAEPGATVTVTSAPGKPKLKVVGIATSVSSADLAWVMPSQLAALRPVNEPALEQMLYTFQRASTPQQIDADVAELQHALPARAVINSVSWLETASKLASIQDINTPFAVAFALIALVLAVLITASVAAAAVVASYRRIGVLKSIGFTPAQIATTYLVQIGIPALAGALAGTLLGNRWVLPLLNGGPGAAAAVPFWINVTVPLALLALTGLAALVPALRAARLSTVQTIVAAQTPRAGHGYAAHRFAGKLAVPRSVSLGLAAAFTRPARSALTLAAVTFGLTAVVLAVGLDSSIAKIDSATTQTLRSVLIGGGVPPHVHTLTPRQQRTIVATLRAQPGTLGYVDEADATASTPGVGPRVPVTAFQGNAAGLGWDITSGTWFTRPGQVVVNTAQPGTAHLAVGQTIHMTRRRQDPHRADHRGGLRPGTAPGGRHSVHQPADPRERRHSPSHHPVRGRRHAREPAELPSIAPASARARLQRQHPQSRIRHRTEPQQPRRGRLRAHRHLADAAADDHHRGTGRSRRAELRADAHPRAYPRPWDIQGTRDDPAANDPHDRLLGRRSRHHRHHHRAAHRDSPPGSRLTRHRQNPGHTHHSRRHARLHHRQPRTTRPRRPWHRPHRRARPSKLGCHLENNNRATRRITSRIRQKRQKAPPDQARAASPIPRSPRPSPSEAAARPRCPL